MKKNVGFKATAVLLSFLLVLQIAPITAWADELNSSASETVSSQLPSGAVSYTHLDVYKRQHLLFHPNLKLNTKLSYISCWLYWWTFFRRFIYIISPILFVVFGIPVVICGLWELLLIWLPSYLLYNHALKITSGKLRTQRWSNIVDTVIFPYMILPILLETLFIKEKKFHVTNRCV